MTKYGCFKSRCRCFRTRKAVNMELDCVIVFLSLLSLWERQHLKIIHSWAVVGIIQNKNEGKYTYIIRQCVLKVCLRSKPSYEFSLKAKDVNCFFETTN